MPELRGNCRPTPVWHGVLVIANSGRMLAQAVRSAGYHALVIDLFADQDTMRVAEQVWLVNNLSVTIIQETIACLILSYEVQWVIYGSGMENHPKTLEYLAKQFKVAGCDYSVLKRLGQKKTLFNNLDVLQIQHPAVQFNPPKKRTDWLLKPMSHIGGIGISRCNRDAQEGEYYQKYCPGDAASVLFCANGEQFQLIGFHSQWTLTSDDFTFAGIRQDPSLAEQYQGVIHSWLKKLVTGYHLKGLASLDFIYNDDGCFFLEINPRPPASMMLYPELDLISAHREGYLATVTTAKVIRALQLIYARTACVIPAEIEWPEWSLDRPHGDASIQRDEPICSIKAQGKTVEQTLSQLKARQTKIENILFNR